MENLGSSSVKLPPLSLVQLCLINIIDFITTSLRWEGCIEQVEERNVNRIFWWKAVLTFVRPCHRRLYFGKFNDENINGD